SLLFTTAGRTSYRLCSFVSSTASRFASAVLGVSMNGQLSALYLRSVCLDYHCLFWPSAPSVALQAVVNTLRVRFDSRLPPHICQIEAAVRRLPARKLE